MTLQWTAFEAVTGRVITDLPTVIPGGPLRRSVSGFDTITAVIPLESAPADWERATRPLASWLACWDDTVLPDGTQPRPILWCGYAVTRRTAATNLVTLGLATAEAYADRRFASDATWSTSQGLQAVFNATVGVLATGPGIPLIVRYEDNADPHFAEQIIWQNTENATIRRRWDETCAALGGEYVIDWAWSADLESIAATLRVGKRIGTAALAGLAPAVTFDVPGHATAFEILEDYSDGKGANAVAAWSSGQGDTTPYAPIVFAGDFQDRPRVVFRWQPASSISEATLTQFAQQAVQILAPGAVAATLTATLADNYGRQFGHDWLLGDDVGYTVEPFDERGQPLLAWPNGLNRVGRAIAAEITDHDITPVFADNAIYQQN